MRATSALLAVLGSVREFGTAILRPLGGPAGVISTFIEVQFESSDRQVEELALDRSSFELSQNNYGVEMAYLSDKAASGGLTAHGESVFG